MFKNVVIGILFGLCTRAAVCKSLLKDASMFGKVILHWGFCSENLWCYHLTLGA
jgi:hypothetical protein